MIGDDAGDAVLPVGAHGAATAATRRRDRSGLAFALWTLFVGVALAAPPGLLGLAPGIEHSLELSLPGTDKVAHFGLVMVHALLGGRWLASWPRVRRGAVVAAALAFVWGAAFELVQMKVPGRDASLGDALADLAGAGVGLALLAAMRRARR